MPTRRLLLAGLPFAAASTAMAQPRAAPVVTILGDSITAGYGLPAADALPVQLQAALAQIGVVAKVRGAGVSGDTSAGGLARVDFSVAPDTALCVVALGANDLLQGLDPDQTKANLNAIVKRLQARHIRVVVAGGKAPMHNLGAYGRRFDAMFEAVAAANHAPLAPDLLAGVEDRPEMKQSDGLHPNAAGVKIIAQRLAPVVGRALKGRG